MPTFPYPEGIDRGPGQSFPRPNVKALGIALTLGLRDSIGVRIFTCPATALGVVTRRVSTLLFLTSHMHFDPESRFVARLFPMIVGRGVADAIGCFAALGHRRCARVLEGMT